MTNHIGLQPMTALRDETKAYCIYCATGKEEKTADLVNMLLEDVVAYPVLQEKHKSVNGDKSNVWTVLVPGYIFVYSDLPISYRNILNIDSVYKILAYQDGEACLAGSDREFAATVYKYTGRIRASKALLINSRVKIIDGPLKDFEGRISKINKHNRNGCVEITIGGITRSVWLAFDYVNIIDLDGED
jgi:transcription termination/antitermination protein NusG